MTEHNDPQINQFVTKVMDMAPEPPTYPATVVAQPEPKRRFPAWVPAPVAAVVVLAVLIPIALRSGDGGEIAATGFTSTTVATDDLAGTEAIDTVSPAPSVEAERNTLLASPWTVMPGAVVEIDFTGDNNIPRSEVFWLDRFDYQAQEWISEYVLWSDRSEGGMSSAQSAVVSIAVPEPTVTADGVDRVTLPTMQLGTYRVCIALVEPSTPCALLEVTDAVVPNTTIPPNEGDPITLANPDFALLNAVPGDETIIATPFQFLFGPDADQVAIDDGFLAEGETLPNDFYLRPMTVAGELELVPAPGFVATVLNEDDPSVTVDLTFDEWVAWILPKPGGVPGSAPVLDMYAHLTYDAQGRVLTVVQQYIP